MKPRRFIAASGSVPGEYITLQANGRICFSRDLIDKLKLAEGDKISFFDDAHDPKAFYLSISDTGISPKTIKKSDKGEYYVQYGPYVRKVKDAHPGRKGTTYRLWVLTREPFKNEGHVYYKLEYRS